MRESHLETGLFGEYASCPRCGNTAPDRRKKRDKVDSMLHSPLRLIHRLLGGKLYHCVFCRLQFYDFRPLRPKPQKDNSQSGAAAQAAKPNTARMAS